MSMSHDVQSRIMQHKQHIGEIGVCLESTIDIAENLERYGLSDLIEEQKEAIIAYINMEANLRDRISLLEKVLRGNLQQPDGVSLADSIRDQTGQLEKKRPVDSYKSHPKFKDFKRKIHAINHPDEMLSDDEEEGLFMVSQQVTVKCPLTKLYFEQPVKNMDCPHSYENDAIRELIRNNKRKRKETKCPVSGCGKYVRENGLTRNTALEDAVRKHRQEELASQQTQLEDAVRL